MDAPTSFGIIKTIRSEVLGRKFDGVRIMAATGAHPSRICVIKWKIEPSQILPGERMGKPFRIDLADKCRGRLRIVWRTVGP